MKVAVIFGTRPEAIKLCPIVRELRGSEHLFPLVCVTAQHRQMLDQVLRAFDVEPDVDLDLMRPDQTLASLTARVIDRVDEVLLRERPDLLVVQGDTTTTLGAALAAFYRDVQVAHVEAGLRTWNLRSPFPEEMNRVVTSRLAARHFAPTRAARDNLLREGVPPDRITVTGNTVIDALHLAVERTRQSPPEIPGLPAAGALGRDRLVLVTGHRRESFGAGFQEICAAIRELSRRFPEVRFVYPVHPNPNVKGPVLARLGHLDNVFLVEPLEYLPFVRLMDLATLILTDSGGVQEEAPSLGKPVLVMRDTTERPEVLEAGVARLVGTSKETIVEEASRLLSDAEAYARMALGANPYGDGRASRRIVACCEEWLRPARQGARAFAALHEAPEPTCESFT